MCYIKLDKYTLFQESKEMDNINSSKNKCEYIYWVAFYKF